MSIGEKIKSLRKARGMTQTELGERVGVQKNAVSKWECGRVDVPTPTLKTLAAIFDVPLSALLEEEAPQKQSRRDEAPRKPDAPRKHAPSRPSRENRPKPRAASNRFAHSRPVKKGKGSFRKKED